MTPNDAPAMTDGATAEGGVPVPDPIVQLTRITQSLSGSLMTSIQALEQLGLRIRALEDQQKTTQLCVAKALLAVGTLAQGVEDETRQMSVFKTLEEALEEIRRSAAGSAKAG
jgi:hypothetical protein